MSEESRPRHDAEHGKDHDNSHDRDRAHYHGHVRTYQNSENDFGHGPRSDSDSNNQDRNDNNEAFLQSPRLFCILRSHYCPCPQDIVCENGSLLHF